MAKATDAREEKGLSSPAVSHKGGGDAQATPEPGFTLIGALPYGPTLQCESAGGSPGTGGSRDDVAHQGFSGPAGSMPYLGQMNQAFGTDFSGVKAHFGGEASQASETLGANAYTKGNDVAFRDREPSRSTVAHELTHVVQQRGGSGEVATESTGSLSSGAAEAEATRVAAAVGQGNGVAGTIGSAPGDVRCEDARGNSSSSGGATPRRVEGRGGYVYDQYPDGRITIVSVNGQKKGIDCPPGSRANIAITGEIGPYVAPGTGSGGSASGSGAEQTGGGASTSGGILSSLKEKGSSLLDSASDTAHGIANTLEDVLVDKPLSLLSGLFSGDGETADPAAQASASQTGNADAPATAPLAGLTADERGKKLATTDGAAAAGAKTSWNLIGTSQNKAAWKEANDSGSAFGPDDLKKTLGGQTGDAFVAAADKKVGEKKFGDDANAMIQAAKGFATSPKALDATQQANAKITWSNLTLDGVAANPQLVARLDRFQQFLAWAGLVTGPTASASCMRSPKTAHKLSVGWMFSASNTTKGSGLHSADNRKKLADNLVNTGGTDLDGTEWVSTASITKVKGVKDDDAGLKTLLDDEISPAARKIQKQDAQAAEGYRDAEHRRPNILPGSGISNHLIGEAADVFQKWVFPNVYDPIIDAMAMYFGLYRACKDLSSSPEHWHYELLGNPPAPAETEASKPAG